MAGLRRRTAVLISGRGSNLAALIAAAADPAYPAEIALVVSDRADAAGLAHAAAAEIPSRAMDARALPGKAAFERELDAALRDAKVELICLAGFMRVLSAEFVDAWRDRLLNIHPSLLPDFPGLDTHRRVLEAGADQHGATVHFVRAEVDRGPIIVQGSVPVRPGDSAEALAARVLDLEHRLYPIALALVASGEARVDGARVLVPDAVRGRHPDLLWP